MKGYRKKTRTAPRKNVKNKFVVTYAGFKTPTEATACAACTSSTANAVPLPLEGKAENAEIEQKGDADEQRTDYRTGLGTGFKA